MRIPCPLTILSSSIIISQISGVAGLLLKFAQVIIILITTVVVWIGDVTRELHYRLVDPPNTPLLEILLLSLLKR